MLFCQKHRPLIAEMLVIVDKKILASIRKELCRYKMSYRNRLQFLIVSILLRRPSITFVTVTDQ
jgi:hypothetical protein